MQCRCEGRRETSIPTSKGPPQSQLVATPNEWIESLACNSNCCTRRARTGREGTARPCWRVVHPTGHLFAHTALHLCRSHVTCREGSLALRPRETETASRKGQWRRRKRTENSSGRGRGSFPSGASRTGHSALMMTAANTQRRRRSRPTSRRCAPTGSTPSGRTVSRRGGCSTWQRRQGLFVLVGVAWEQHVTFLSEPDRMRSIADRVRSGVA